MITRLPQTLLFVGRTNLTLRTSVGEFFWQSIEEFSWEWAKQVRVDVAQLQIRNESSPDFNGCISLGSGI